MRSSNRGSGRGTPLPHAYPVARAFDRRMDKGPFDVIGDVHGCLEELKNLIEKLGYLPNPDGGYHHPKGRKLIFVGDLVDLGPDSVGVLKLVMNLVTDGDARVVMGNHDDDVSAALQPLTCENWYPRYVKRSVTLIRAEPEALQQQIMDFLQQLPFQLVLDDGRLVITHAGVPKEYIGRNDEESKARSLTIPERIPLPGFHAIWLEWTADYDGPLQIHGHESVLNVLSQHGVVNVDTGCMFGNTLSALRYPELVVCQTSALDHYINTRYPLQNPMPTDRVVHKVEDPSRGLD